ncbi:MAG: ATP-binding cassette domain-containing protein, partial [Chloroflexota bacterium]
IKILSGVYSADQGQFEFDGRRVDLNTPSAAQRIGIATVYQDLSLVNTRPVAHNIFLGREPRRWGWILDQRKMEKDAQVILERLRIQLPSVAVDVEVLSGGQRQAVAVARSIAQSSQLLLLDEPWASLGVEQTQKVRLLMKDLRSHGVAIILITHDLSEIISDTDRIAVLRQGRLVGYTKSSQTTQHEIIGWITGAVKGEIRQEEKLQ